MPLHVVPQSRHEGVGMLVWDPREGSAPLRNYMQTHGQFDVILMFGGITPAFGRVMTGNADLAKTVLRACASVGIPRVLMASSSAVYGTTQDTPYTERDTLVPSSDYGRDKIEMEQVCASFRREGIDICCLRIGNVAGADALLLNAFDPKKKLSMTLDKFENDRGPLRTYIGPASLARALETLALHPNSLPETLNIGLPEPVFMDDLLKAAKIPFNFIRAREIAKQYICLDCSVLSSLHEFDAAEKTATSIVNQALSLKEAHT